MNKEILKLQNKLQEAKLIREQKKANYDGTIIMLEGHRRNIKSFEERTNEAAGVYMESDRVVSEIELQLKKAIDESETKEIE